MPSGLTLRPNGLINGVPNTAGSTTFSVTVTDSAGTPVSVTLPFTLVINPPQLVVSTQSLPDAFIGAAYTQPLSATGGTPPYTWSLISGTLPAGLQLFNNNGFGSIRGIPTGPVSTSAIVVGVRDSSATQMSAMSGSLTLNVRMMLPLPSVTLTDATIGKNLQTTLAVTLAGFSGAANITFSSDNPDVLLSKFSGTVGQQTLTVNGAISNFIIYAEALSGSGIAHITTSTPGAMTNGSSTITLSPSGFILSGPNGVGGNFPSNQGAVTPVSVIAVQLDSSGNIGPTQQVRAGLNQLVTLSNSNSTVGSFPPSVTFTGGTDTVTANFVASNTSTLTTTLTANEPVGYSVPAGNANTLSVSVQTTQLTPSNVTVGQGLEAPAVVTLGKKTTIPLVVTLTSSDPNKLLLSTDPTKPGMQTIMMTIACGQQGCGSQTQPFYVYGLATSGTVGYTASASGYNSAQGLVTMAPSGFALESQAGVGQDFFTVVGFSASFLNVDSGILDTAGNFIAQQALAGGQTVSVAVTSSVPAVGTVISPVTITGGNSSATTQFTPKGMGTTLLTAVTPAGFSTTVQATLHALVNLPNIRIDDGDTIGRDLEQQGTIFLGSPAPAGGASVVLTATGALQLSKNEDGPRGAQITVVIPAGQIIGSYFMYARDSLGTASVSATSTGYNSGSGTENLAPSGVVVVGPFGIGFDDFVNLSDGPAPVTVSTALLDANSFFVAALPLAPTPNGLPLQVGLTSSDTSIGTIASPATIAIGSSTTTAVFTPRATGTTVITAARPANFAPPSNGGTLTVHVN